MTIYAILFSTQTQNHNRKDKLSKPVPCTRPKYRVQRDEYQSYSDKILHTPYTGKSLVFVLASNILQWKGVFWKVLTSKQNSVSPCFSERMEFRQRNITIPTR